MAQQGLLLTVKAHQLGTQEQESLLTQKYEDFGVLDESDFSEMEQYLSLAYMYLEKEETDHEYPPAMDAEPASNHEDDLAKMAASEQDAKDAVFSFQLAAHTLSHLYRKRRPSYHTLSPFAPISQDEVLYKQTADWMLNHTPEHTYFRLKKLGDSHHRAKRAIAAAEPIGMQSIKEFFRLGHFLAALHTLTKSVSRIQ